MRHINTHILMNWPHQLGRHLWEFVAAPASARPLAVFRIGLAAVLLFRTWALWNHVLALYGCHGIMQWSIAELIVPEAMPRLSWVVAALSPWQVSADACVWGVFLVSLLSSVCLLVGWHTRKAAIVAWFSNLLLFQTGMMISYGVNVFIHIALFYCMWMPVGDVWSIDRWRGKVSGKPTSAARLSLRVLQIHLCIVYLSATWHKACGEQWWNGEAIWRALMRHDLGQFDLSWYSWLATVPWVAMLAGWGTLLVEGGYAFFVWPRLTRKWWVGATIGLHLGIGIFMGLWSFSALMIVLTGSAFLVSPEPRQIAGVEEDLSSHSQPVHSWPTAELDIQQLRQPCTCEQELDDALVQIG